MKQLRQSGVGLIEVLLTVVLLSVGFLTMARMQVQGMRFSQSAYIKSQASLMASDMADRMRANIEGVRAGHYDDARTSAVASDPGCQDKACEPDEVAAQDLFDWSAHLYPLEGTAGFIPMLPSSENIEAQGSITRLAPGRYSIRLNWAERLDGELTQVPLRLDFVSQD